MSGSSLVPFSVSHSVLDPRVAGSLHPGHYRRLVNLWRDVGVLVLRDGEQGTGRLAALVRDLPQEARKIMGEALVAQAQGLLRARSENAVPVTFKTCPVDVPDGCSRRALVHAADRETATRFGGLPTGFEAVALEVLDQACAFESALALTAEPVRARGAVDEAWAERVVPVLAFATRRITLVDHYAVSRAWSHRHDTGRWEKSGLWRFLREAAKHKGSVDVEVIAGEDNEHPGRMLDGLRECADEVGGRSRRWKVNAFFPQSHRFKAAVHYRCVLVDANTCLLIDSGIEAFTGDKIKRTVPTRLVPPDVAIRDDIDDLKRSVKPVVI